MRANSQVGRHRADYLDQEHDEEAQSKNRVDVVGQPGERVENQPGSQLL